MNAPRRQPGLPTSTARLEHLAYGWQVRNIDASGTGFGVFAHSTDWPRTLGTMGEQLGTLIRRLDEPGDLIYTREFRKHRLLVRNNPVPNSREGSYLVHMIDVSDRAIGMPELLAVIAAGIPFDTDASFPEDLPTPRAEPLTVTLHAEQPSGFGRPTVELVAALLSCTDGTSAAMRFDGAEVRELVTDLRRACACIPQALQPDMELKSWAPRGRTGPAFTTFAVPEPRVKATDVTFTRSQPTEAWVTRADLSKYQQLAHDLVTLVVAGVALPQVGSMAELGTWVASRELMMRAPRDLSDADVSIVLSGGADSRAWLDHPANVDRALAASLSNDSAADMLAQHHRLAPIAGLLRRLCESLYAADPDIAAAHRLLNRFDIDWVSYADIAADTFLQRHSPGAEISAFRQAAVFPVLVRSTSGRLAELSGDLFRHASFRHAVAESSNAALIRQLIENEAATELRDRDTTALEMVAVRNPALLATALPGPDLGATMRWLAWIVDTLTREAAESVCYSALNEGVNPQVVLSALNTTQRDDGEVARILQNIWPAAARSLRIPDRIVDLLQVTAPVNERDRESWLTTVQSGGAAASTGRPSSERPGPGRHKSQTNGPAREGLPHPGSTHDEPANPTPSPSMWSRFMKMLLPRDRADTDTAVDRQAGRENTDDQRSPS